MVLDVPASATMAAAETNRVGKSENCLPEQMLRRQQQATIKQNMAEKQRPCGRNDEESVSLEAVQMLPALNELAGLWNNCRICLTRESELRGFPLVFCCSSHWQSGDLASQKELADDQNTRRVEKEYRA